MELKEKILAGLIEKLEAEMMVMRNAAAGAREAATHEESIAEDKYDTRGLEASYLAGGQGRRAAELQVIIEALKNLKLKKFSQEDAIQLTALIDVETEGQQSKFFVAPKGGGTIVTVDGLSVQVVSPESRLGTELMGKFAGDVVEIKSPIASKEYEILAVS